MPFDDRRKLQICLATPGALCLMTVCKLLSDATHICTTAVAQLTQISLAVHIGGSTVCIYACVCALQQQNGCVKEICHHAEAKHVMSGFAGGELCIQDLVIMELDVVRCSRLSLRPRCSVQLGLQVINTDTLQGITSESVCTFRHSLPSSLPCKAKP